MSRKTKRNKARIINSDLNKKREIRKKRGSSRIKKFLLKLLFYVFLVAFLAGIPYFVFVRDFLSLKNIEIYGAEKISRDQLMRETEEMINDKWLQLIPKNNIIFPWGKMIRSKFLLEYPIFQKIEVKRKFPDTIQIFFQERKPQLIQNAPNLNCVYDQNGELFDLARDFSYLGDDNINVIQLLDEKPFTECSEKMSVEFLDFIAKIKQLLQENLGIELERFWETPNLASGDLRVLTREGWGIRLDKNLGAQKEFEMLSSVLENEVSQEERNGLEYIDLRTKNRIYISPNDQQQIDQEEDKKDEDKKDDE